MSHFFDEATFNELYILVWCAAFIIVGVLFLVISKKDHK
jgi:hypothetical protein